MAASWVPIILFTLFWLVVGAVLPFFVPKSENRGITQTMLVTTAVCCYLFWLCTYMMQMNPLFGPQLSDTVLIVMRNEW